jgi:peptide deformylase
VRHPSATLSGQGRATRYSDHVSAYQIRVFGDPVLTQRASEVTDIDGKLARLAEDMVETMHEAHGLGLAAPQVGVQKRIFVYQMGESEPITIINPTIVETRGEWEHEEGCLSIPGLYFPIVRPKEVHLKGFDIHGNEISIEADELEARCFQHELDHLDGRLLLSLLDKDQKREAMRELRRRAEEVGS